MRMFRARGRRGRLAPLAIAQALFHSGRFAYLGMQALVDRLRDTA